MHDPLELNGTEVRLILSLFTYRPPSGGLFFARYLSLFFDNAVPYI